MRAAERLTVSEAADEVFAGMEAGSVRTRSGDRYKPSAVLSYRGSFELYVRPVLGAMRVTDVERRHVQRPADELVADELSPSTVRNALMPLRVVYRRALRDNLVAVNPCQGLELPANRGRRGRIASADEAVQLLAALPSPFDRALWRPRSMPACAGVS